MELPNFEQLDSALRSQNFETSSQLFKDLNSKHEHSVELIKTHLELQLRSRALELGKKDASSGEIQKLLDFIVQLAQEEMCTKPFTVGVLQDIFDVSTKRTCEKLFSVVEYMIATWKSPFFFDACKNSVLRMCNDLLKRLSQTTDTVFCGRILILLAKALPLNERSGLNLMSQVNISNITTYDEDIEMKEETEEDNGEIEVGEIRDQNDLNVDYELYVKFWKLQSVFVSPAQIYNEDKFLAFESDLTDILTLFADQKLERPREEDSLRPVENGITDNSLTDELNSFSAKYLTNQKLFHLQLADSQFRRYFLTQCLIFTSYLSNPSIKSRDPTLFLTPPQEKSVTDWTEKCYQLLKETYPQGSKFTDSLKKALKSDKSWSDWKNDGCPDLVSELPTVKLAAYKRRDIDTYNPNTVDLGNSELTRLWNINVNNLEACKMENRVFYDTFKGILEEFLDEVDPDQQVEEQYMKIHEEKFQWNCSRHLTTNCYQHYSLSKAGGSAEQSKPEFASASAHLKRSMLRVSENIPELKDRTVEIEARLAIVAQKQAEQEEQARQAALAAAAKRAEEKKAAAEKKAAEEAKNEEKRDDDSPTYGPKRPTKIEDKPEPTKDRKRRSKSKERRKEKVDKNEKSEKQERAERFEKMDNIEKHEKAEKRNSKKDEDSGSEAGSKKKRRVEKKRGDDG